MDSASEGGAEAGAGASSVLTQGTAGGCGLGARRQGRADERVADEQCLTDRRHGRHGHDKLFGASPGEDLGQIAAGIHSLLSGEGRQLPASRRRPLLAVGQAHQPERVRLGVLDADVVRDGPAQAGSFACSPVPRRLPAGDDVGQEADPGDVLHDAGRAAVVRIPRDFVYALHGIAVRWTGQGPA